MRRRLPVLAAATAILSPRSVLAQALGGGGGGAPDVSLIRVVAALALCLAVAFAAALLLRRRGVLSERPQWWALLGKAAIPARLAIVESRRISQHADLCLVRCDGIDYLILSGPAQAQLLLQRPTETD